MPMGLRRNIDIAFVRSFWSHIESWSRERNIRRDGYARCGFGLALRFVLLFSFVSICLCKATAQDAHPDSIETEDKSRASLLRNHGCFSLGVAFLSVSSESNAVSSTNVGIGVSQLFRIPLSELSEKTSLWIGFGTEYYGYLENENDPNRQRYAYTSMYSLGLDVILRFSNTAYNATSAYGVSVGAGPLIAHFTPGSSNVLELDGFGGLRLLSFVELWYQTGVVKWYVRGRTNVLANDARDRENRLWTFSTSDIHLGYSVPY